MSRKITEEDQIAIWLLGIMHGSLNLRIDNPAEAARVLAYLGKTDPRFDYRPTTALEGDSA